jgi:hypothetical protein
MSTPTAMAPSRRSPQKPRGVFRADWSGPQGEPVFVARDSRGKIIADRMVRDGQDPETERVLLWTYLNWRDPVGDSRSGSFRR